jgi:hypothetical protein
MALDPVNQGKATLAPSPVACQLKPMAERLRPVVDLFAQCACGAVSISV